MGALDRLAQYYIKLAENTFPVIEIDAGREVDIVLTKGTKIDLAPADGGAPATEDSSGPDDAIASSWDSTGIREGRDALR